jgi:hypothetical protein
MKELSVLSEYWLIDPNLIAYWKLDETKGTLANDYMGNKHIGKLMGDRCRWLMCRNRMPQKKLWQQAL